MKKKQLRWGAAFLALALTVTGTFPAHAASGTINSGAEAANVSNTTTTVTKKTTPTCDPLLAQRVLVAMGVLDSSRITPEGLKQKVTRQRFAKLLVKLSPYKDQVGTAVKTSMYSDVKKTSAFVPYISLAVKNGWMKGNLKGKFRPGQAVTLQESVAAVLSVLGYSDTDFKGNRVSAKMSLYKSKKLNKNITKKSDEAMTYGDLCALFYNMLVTETKDGTIYGKSLGLTFDNNGDVSYLPLVYDDLDGPVIAKGDWQSQIPLDMSQATVYIDGSKNSVSNIRAYDVVYYSKKVNGLFVYQKRVTGQLDSVSPDRYIPDSVTVDGTSYALTGQQLSYEASAMGTYEIGDYVTLLLGRNDAVVGMGTAAEMNSFIGGIVLSKTEKVSSDKNSNAVKKYVTILDTLGETHEFELDDLNLFYDKAPVEVVFDDGKPVVNRVNLSWLYGVVSVDARSYAGYQLPDSIRILEYDDSGNYSPVSRQRLARMNINSGQILYYHVSANGELTDMILRDVTGDSYKYGILLSADELEDAQTMTFMGTYQYLIGTKSDMVTTSGRTFGMHGYSGPVQFAFSRDGTLEGIRELGSMNVTSITQAEVSDGQKTYYLSNDVMVYLKNESDYYQIDLSKVLRLARYELTAYFDGTTGGKVRVIIAEEK